MQFNSYTYNEMARESYNGHGEFKEAGDAEFQYLPSTATTLVVVTTYADCRDHVIATATLSDDKINLLLNAQSNDDEVFTSVVLHFYTEQFLVNDRQKALAWLGVVRRSVSRLVDADMVEYIDEHERITTS